MLTGSLTTPPFAVTSLSIVPLGTCTAPPTVMYDPAAPSLNRSPPTLCGAVLSKPPTCTSLETRPEPVTERPGAPLHRLPPMSYLEELDAPRFAPTEALSPDCPVAELNESVVSVPLHDSVVHEHTANLNVLSVTSPMQASPDAVGMVTTEPEPAQNAPSEASSGEGFVPAPASRLPPSPRAMASGSWFTSSRPASNTPASALPASGAPDGDALVLRSLLQASTNSVAHAAPSRPSAIVRVLVIDSSLRCCVRGSANPSSKSVAGASGSSDVCAVFAAMRAVCPVSALA